MRVTFASMKNPFRLLLFSLFTAAVPLTAAEPLQVTLESLRFVAPADWVAGPVPSAMRKATWLTSKDDTAAEVAFFAFGKDQGGTVSDNIQRWLDQFSESQAKGESATVQINGRAVTFVRSEGIFSSGMPGGPVTPLPGYGLFGAIIETPEGNVFFKATGPLATVKGLEQTFTEIVTNAAKS